MNSWRRYAQHFLLAFALILVPGAASLAQDKSAAALRVVLKGHDPVAYFTERRPVKGVPELSYDWDGERYLFANAGNRSKFVADPDRYAPRFGGYCTGSMARGVRNEADPEAWIIADGKLYVFGAVKFRDIAQKDPAWLTEKVTLAGEHWRQKK